MANAQPMESLRQAAQAAFAGGFNGAIRVVLTDGDPFVIDGRADENCIVEGAGETSAECEWRLSRAVAEDIFAQRIEPVHAFATEQLEISGDFSVMARLAWSQST